MLKKIIVMVLICTLLIPFTSAIAADSESEIPTVEEILNQYHEKSFRAKALGILLCTNGKTPEEETVEMLNACGYDAYYITNENYNDLQSELKTDFTDMGLDPNSTYILTFGGTENKNTRAVGNPNLDRTSPDLEGADVLLYEYNGKTYTMRYATVTCTADDDMYVESSYSMKEEYWTQNLGRNIVNTTLVAMGDAIAAGVFGKAVPIATIASLVLGSTPSNDVYTQVPKGTFTIIAATTWTCNYIQVWDATYKRWESPHSADYTTSMAYCVGTYYDPVSNSPQPITKNPYYVTMYASRYFDLEQRKADTMRAYGLGTILAYTVDRVDFHFGDQEGEVIIDATYGALFSHKRSFKINFPNG